MSDLLRIRGLEVLTTIGVPDEERAQPQRVLIDADISLDMSPAAESDDVTDTLDYGRLVAEIEALAASSERKLLERLAGEIADLILGHAGVSEVVVEVAKGKVPVSQKVSAVSVRVIRAR